MKWLKRIIEYYNDKKMADKYGLTVKDICIHESDHNMLLINPGLYRCIKCGEFYR